MPRFPNVNPLDWTEGKYRSRSMSVGFVSLAGDTYSMNLSGLGAGVDLTIGEKQALADACGDISNMGCYRLSEKKDTVVNIADASALDEAYANHGDVLAMHFQNNDGEKYVFDIPAPDAALFETDGVTLKPRTDATVGTLIGAAIDAAETVINTSWTPHNSFAFVRGIRRSRKVKLSGGQGEKPAIAEGTGDIAGPAV